VPVQGNGIELRQNRDLINMGIYTITDGNIDQAIFTRDRHGRLGPHQGKRVKPGAAASSQDDRKYLIE
jgi:hypothetical protein